MGLERVEIERWLELDRGKGEIKIKKIQIKKTRTTFYTKKIEWPGQ